MPKKKEEKIEKGNLQEAVDEIKQRFGEGAIMKLKDVRDQNKNSENHQPDVWSDFH